MRLAIALLVLPAASTAPLSVSVTAGPARPPLLAGYGGEFVFQTSTDAVLNAALAAAAPAATRFPGGTPADYFDWQTGWLNRPTGPGCGGCDALQPRPTLPSQLAAFAAATAQEVVLALNTLTSNLSHQLAGVAAFASAGVPASRYELGNELYDATRADVVAAFPTPGDYAARAAAWTRALLEARPGAHVGWVGVASARDNRTRAWNPAVAPLAAASGARARTLHLYPGRPSAHLSDPAARPRLLAPIPSLLRGFREFTDATIPPPLRLWVTEWGTWGCAGVEGTWLQGLWHAAFALALPAALPRAEVLLPYCAVCGDPAMPAFTTAGAGGAVVPPNATVPPGGWLRTPSGHAYALAFAALAARGGGGAGLAPLAFEPNPALDPGGAEPGAALAGLLAEGAGVAVVANVGAGGVALRWGALPLGCAPGAGACASAWWAKGEGDVARQGLRVEELGHWAGPLAGGEALALPGYGMAVLRCGGGCE